jgi:hypothetical protein|tara:strand:- start:203 stop:472 length:270 start_codon:yes stop_codon:yes gene_type:complete
MNTMDDFKTDEEELAKVLEDMTPLELATHNSMVSAFMISQYGLVEEVMQAIKEVEILKNTADLEERALLPFAEAELVQLIKSLPTFAEA